MFWAQISWRSGCQRPILKLKDHLPYNWGGAGYLFSRLNMLAVGWKYSPAFFSHSFATCSPKPHHYTKVICVHIRQQLYVPVFTLICRDGQSEHLCSGRLHHPMKLAEPPDFKPAREAAALLFPFERSSAGAVSTKLARPSARLASSFRNPNVQVQVLITFLVHAASLNTSTELLGVRACLLKLTNEWTCTATDK